MFYQPNPTLSLKENLKLFETHFNKNRWYKNVCVGILSPLYPLCWLADIPIRQKDKKTEVKLVTDVTHVKPNISNTEVL